MSPVVTHLKAPLGAPDLPPLRVTWTACHAGCHLDFLGIGTSPQATRASSGQVAFSVSSSSGGHKAEATLCPLFASPTVGSALFCWLLGSAVREDTH